MWALQGSLATSPAREQQKDLCTFLGAPQLARGSSPFLGPMVSQGLPILGKGRTVRNWKMQPARCQKPERV